MSGLRDHSAQRVLSELAALPNVHLAASVDHVNAALLWDQQVCCVCVCVSGVLCECSLVCVGVVCVRVSCGVCARVCVCVRTRAHVVCVVEGQGRRPPAVLPPHCGAQTRDRFSWVWHNATNYEPYHREVGYAGEGRGGGARAGVMVLRGPGRGMRQLVPAGCGGCGGESCCWSADARLAVPAPIAAVPARLAAHLPACLPPARPRRSHPLPAGGPQRAVQQAERDGGAGQPVAQRAGGVPPRGRRPAGSLRRAG